VKRSHIVVVAFLAPTLNFSTVALTAQHSPAEQKIAAAEIAIQKNPTKAEAYSDLAMALARRAREGGSWLVRTSLAQVGRWLVERGEVARDLLADVGEDFYPAEIARWSIETETPVGWLRHLAPAVRLSETPPFWARPSVPLGYHEAVWPARTG